MGLINEVNNISQEIRTQNEEKKRKEAERIKKQNERIKKENKKINLERIEKDTLQYLTSIFQEHFTKYGTSYEIEFLSIDRKNKILEQCKRDLLGEPSKNLFDKNFMIEENRKIIEIFNKNYYKILKEQKIIFLNNEKYIFNKQLKEAEKLQQQQQQATKKETFQKINKAAGQAASIGILAAAGGLSILLGAAIKGSNKKRRF